MGVYSIRKKEPPITGVLKHDGDEISMRLRITQKYPARVLTLKEIGLKVLNHFKDDGYICTPLTIRKTGMLTDKWNIKRLRFEGNRREYDSIRTNQKEHKKTVILEYLQKHESYYSELCRIFKYQIQIHLKELLEEDRIYISKTKKGKGKDKVYYKAK